MQGRDGGSGSQAANPGGHLRIQREAQKEGEGGRTHLMHALVVRPLTPHPFETEHRTPGEGGIIASAKEICVVSFLAAIKIPLSFQLFNPPKLRYGSKLVQDLLQLWAFAPKNEAHIRL